MRPFADRLVESVQKTGSPCVVGLDPRIDLMPAFIKSGRGHPTPDVIRSVIRDFHELALDTIAGLASIVKPQLAFFEQYGSAGIQAFEDTVHAAQQRALLVIADGKRNDVDSTAEAYAAAYLGKKAFNVDGMTVTPYLGRDSMLPYVDACREYGKGIFIVLKTSNPGSRDYQDQMSSASMGSAAQTSEAPAMASCHQISRPGFIGAAAAGASLATRSTTITFVMLGV